MERTSSSVARWVGPGVLLVLATALLSGVSTFLNGYAVQGTNSDAFVTVRNLAVAGLLAPVAAVVAVRSRAGVARRDWGALALIGLVGGAVPFLLFFRGLQLATADGGQVTASFVYRTLFLFATVLAVVVLRERFHPRAALAAGLLMGGNVLLLSLTEPVWTDGTLYVLAATVLWAVEYSLSKRALTRLRGTTVALGRMGFGAVFLAGYLALTSQWGGVAHLSGGQWAWVGISAALLTGFVLTWYTGLARLDLGVATSVLVLGFPITWLLGIVARGGAVPLLPLVGAAVVTAGVIVALGTDLLRATWEYARGTRLLRPTA